jgi:hypothetical protein
MGELCLRWAMKLPADVPIEWPENATFSMYQIREALLSLNDDTDLPRLSVRFLAARTGLALSTVRTTLKCMEKPGQLPFGREGRRGHCHHPRADHPAR